MSLVAHVVRALEACGARYALIGAGALAVHGVARSTLDIDLLTVSEDCLNASTWESLKQMKISVEIRRGDADDPLAGVVRFEQDGERPVDLVVGRHRWQTRIIERATDTDALGMPLPAALAHDLVLLKLYAGGAQDAWDVEQLLAGPNREELVSAVEEDLDDLPAEAVTLWRRIMSPDPT